MIEEQSVEQGGLTLEYELQREDFLDGVKAVMRKFRMLSFISWPVYLTLCGMVAALLIALQIVSHSVNIYGVIVPVLAALQPFSPRLYARMCLKAKKYRGQMRMTADEQGFLVEGAHARTQDGWTKYGSYAETPRVFVLRSPDRSERGFMVVPKRGARRPADLDRLRAILDRHLARD